MSPSGVVSSRWVNPVPGPVVPVHTMLAPTSRSLAFFVIAAALVLVALSPVAVEAASRGLTVATPLYSKIRMSAEIAAALK
jgi:hypothetical protein